jgi:hypothetical protein
MSLLPGGKAGAIQDSVTKPVPSGGWKIPASTRAEPVLLMKKPGNHERYYQTNIA